MPEQEVDAGLVVCESAALAERGAGHVFDVMAQGQPARAFVLRIDGQVFGYLNRCAHLPSELDWQPGKFLDSERREIICAVHGATYDPCTGQCTGGPAGRGRLTALTVSERDGRVYWYPSPAIRPVVFD